MVKSILQAVQADFPRLAFTIYANNFQIKDPKYEME